MKYDMPAQVSATADGFRALAQLCARVKSYKGEEVEINMAQTRWFSTQMCPLFGAILHQLQAVGSKVFIAEFTQDVERALSQNEFLSHFGGEKIDDHWKTAIPYRKFRSDPKAENESNYDFNSYVKEWILEKDNMKDLSANLREDLKRNLWEVFNNVTVHARSKHGAFACGQFFYHKNRFAFGISDLGIGIRQSVNAYTGKNMTAAQAIEWALDRKNSTKGVGGHGLNSLMELADKHDGRLRIASGDCYWRHVKGISSKDAAFILESELPGTTVIVEIDTAISEKKTLPLNSAAAHQRETRGSIILTTQHDMPYEVRTVAGSFNALATLYEHTKKMRSSIYAGMEELRAEAKERHSEEIEFNMDGTQWFSGEMCAPFGAILYELGESVLGIPSQYFTNISPALEKALSQNKFLSNYDHEQIADESKTTIPYQHFPMKGDDDFYYYVEKVVNMEQVSHLPALRKRLQQSMSEVFSNAALHARSGAGVFACGQFYPRKEILAFAVSDLGIGIRQRVNKDIGKNWSTEEAIEWAVQAGNTTKKNMPGGLGLAFLTKLIDNNNGARLVIASDDCFWQRENKHNSHNVLQSKFPGTTIVVEINTAVTDISGSQL